MWRRLRQIGLITLILGGLGCQHNKSSVVTKTPPDPLLISKKPVEGRPTSLETTTVARDAQPTVTPTVRLGYRPDEDMGVTLGKPRWVPDNR